MLTSFLYSIIPGFKSFIVVLDHFFQVIQSSQITSSIYFLKYICILCESYICLLHHKPVQSIWNLQLVRNVPVQQVVMVLIEKYHMRPLKIALAMYWSLVAKQRQNHNARRDMIPLQLIYCIWLYFCDSSNCTELLCMPGSGQSATHM